MFEDQVGVSSANFWEERYRAGQTGWDRGRAAPAFETLLGGPSAPKPGRLAVVGCGRGHDARLFAGRGFQVVGFDFAPSAVAAAREAAAREGLAMEFVAADIFALPDDYAGAFDYVVEHTCFCAIDPARRAEYVSAVARLLQPGGELIALFLVHRRPGGPPYTTDEAEVRRLFQGRFRLDQLDAPAELADLPSGFELFGRFRRV